MLADAIRAEGFRLSKSRTTWFWSVFFVPIISLAFSVIGAVVMKANEAKMLESIDKMPPGAAQMFGKTPINVAEALATAAGKLDNPMLLAFVLIGAATLYAADYRWETWRLISARNTRRNLLAGKVAVTAMLSLVAMLVMLAAGLGETFIQAAVFKRGLTFDLTSQMVGQFFALSGLSLLRIIQFTLLGLLAAVVTRSLLAALFIPLVAGVAQFFSPQLFAGMGMTPDQWLPALFNPGGATDALKVWAAGGPMAGLLPDGLVLKAWIAMAIWTLLPLVGALAWFQKQDLSKE
ncbi:MAG: hypothetical protein EON89_13050 [Brevundimonas sp.]|nr:MAG: hypothetical protein EON89_13050 [Brevundimonas sp.]